MSTLLFIVCLFAGWILFQLILALTLGFLEERKVKKAMKSMMPQVADPKKLCKGPHSWILARTLTKDGPGSTQVCRICGFISGSNKVASMESIDRIEERNRIMEIEARLLRDFLTKEDDQMKKYFDSEIKGGLDFEKITHIHSAGMTFSQRFLVYKASKAEEIEKELTKSDA